MNKVTDSEWAVIGGVLIKPSSLSELDLIPNDFIGENNRIVYEAFLDAEKAGEAIDLITIAERLEKHSRRGWLSLLGTIHKNTGSAANIKSYARIVKEESQKRRAVEIANNLITDIEGEESVDHAIKALMHLNVTKKDHSSTIKQALTDAINDIDAKFNSGEMVGVSSGLTDLDDCLGGFHKTDLYIVAARPAMGKTAFMLNLANSCDVPCGIISGEQGRQQIGGRMISINGKVSVHRTRTGKLEDEDWPKITRAVGMLADRPIYIYDKPGPTITDVIREARRLKFQNDIKILFLDYVQKIRATHMSNPKHIQVEEVVSSLKDLARELDIPIVALAQVNRNVESKPNKRPTMSDIKDSGSIEQEADNIMTLYRDEVYNRDTDQKGIVEIAVMKNRHGPLGMIKAAWKGEFMVFDNWSNVTYWGQE